VFGLLTTIVDSCGLFQGTVQEAPIPNPEIEGGHIVLIAQNNNQVQRPSQVLDRMHASYMKQAAFNRRIQKTEDEISGINADLMQFVHQCSDRSLWEDNCGDKETYKWHAQTIQRNQWLSRQFTTHLPGDTCLR
jgi:hypothetical protein